MVLIVCGVFGIEVSMWECGCLGEIFLNFLGKFGVVKVYGLLKLCVVN